MNKLFSILRFRWARGAAWIAPAALAIALLGSTTANATLIVGAPTENIVVNSTTGFAWWGLTPPYNLDLSMAYAVEFTLADPYDISHIDVSFYSLGSNPAQPFEWSLQDSLTGTPTVYASGSFTGSHNPFATNETLPVDSNLGTGTYYLIASSGPFDTSRQNGSTGGWIASDGTLVSNGGTGEDGIWQYYPGSPGDWIHYDTNSPDCYINAQYICQSPVYAVYSSDVTSVPEPGTLLLLGNGFIVLVTVRKYCLKGRHS